MRNLKEVTIEALGSEEWIDAIKQPITKEASGTLLAEMLQREDEGGLYWSNHCVHCKDSFFTHKRLPESLLVMCDVCRHKFHMITLAQALRMVEVEDEHGI